MIAKNSKKKKSRKLRREKINMGTSNKAPEGETQEENLITITV